MTNSSENRDSSVRRAPFRIDGGSGQERSGAEAARNLWYRTCVLTYRLKSTAVVLPPQMSTAMRSPDTGL